MKFSKYLILLSSIIFIDSVAMESEVKVVPKVPLAVLQVIAKGSINQNGGTEKEIFAATDKMVKLGGNSFRAVMNLVKLYAKQNDKPDNYNYGNFKADIMDYILNKRYHKKLNKELSFLIYNPDKNKILELLKLGANSNFSDTGFNAYFVFIPQHRRYVRQFYATYFQLFMYQIFCFLDRRISGASTQSYSPLGRPSAKYDISIDLWGLKSEELIEIIELLLQFGANPLLADRHGGLASAYSKLENTLGRMGIWDPIEFPKEKQPKILIFLNDIKKLFDMAIEKRNFDKREKDIRGIKK